MASRGRAFEHNLKPSNEAMSVRFSEACHQSGGSQLASCDGYEMPSHCALISAVEALGHQLTVPKLLQGRKGVLRRHRSKLVAAYPATDDDPGIRGWSRQKSKWERVVGKIEPEETIEQLDTWLRCLETPQSRHAGWAFLKEDGTWAMSNTTSNAKLVALYVTRKPKGEVEAIMGHCERHPHKIVSVPFAPVELPGRRWNLDAPQWRFDPVPGEHPHWDIVLDHIGQSLTPYLRFDWAKTGGDYLRTIIASILREPFAPTPYLFLFGPENSGKSIFHEAFDLLVTKGVVKADRALTSRSDFNGELAGCVLAVVEEKDISQCPGAHAKIKEAVTALKLSIRKMYVESFEIDNCVHWVQCANSPLACPKFPGDSRIQPIYVGPPERDIPKSVLLAALQEEAPAFLHTIKHVTLPPLTGRLRIPLVETEHSKQLEARNTDPVILGIVEFATAQKSWRGTAPQLAEAVEGAPRDYRRLSRYLIDNEMLLARHGVRFREVPQAEGHKGTRQLQLDTSASSCS
jgi:hypothetical protein